MPSRKLGHLCEEAGIRHEECHHALDDARATAHLLVHLVRESRRQGWVNLEHFGCSRAHACPAATWAPPPSGRRYSRAAAAESVRQERGYLARLVERLPPRIAYTDPASVEYLAVLDRALEDRLVTGAEAEGLVAFASAAGLSREHVLELHREYLSRLAACALYDGEVTGSERRDLELVCDLLDLHQAALAELLSQAAPNWAPAAAESLDGMTVCFTGQLAGRYRGEQITREVAQRLAADAGLVVAESVTKRLDLLVVADPHTASGKATKARRYGTRILAEAAFWTALGVAVD